jgi:hypothetical protein
MSSIYIGNCICHAESSSLSHTQQRLAQGNRQQQQLTFLILFFFLAGLPLLYKSVLFAGLMVCVSCSLILQQHYRSRSHQSVCIIIKVLDRSGTQTCFYIYILYTGTDWDGRFYLFLILGGQTFGEYLPRRKSCCWANGKCIYRRSCCCGYLVAVYSGRHFRRPPVYNRLMTSVVGPPNCSLCPGRDEASTVGPPCTVCIQTSVCILPFEKKSIWNSRRIEKAPNDVKYAFNQGPDPNHQDLFIITCRRHQLKFKNFLKRFKTNLTGKFDFTIFKKYLEK